MPADPRPAPAAELVRRRPRRPRPPRPVPTSAELAAALRADLQRVADDPATDPRGREWLLALLAGETAAWVGPT